MLAGLSWQVYTLNHDITCAALRGDSRGDLRLFKLRTQDHIPSLKTAKQRHLNKVQTSQADCHPPAKEAETVILLTPSHGLAGFAKKSDVQTTKPNPFKYTLMSSELKESQVGFDLRDKAHPSRTHRIKTEGSHCFPWEKDEQEEKMAKPKILFNLKFT